MRKHAQDPAPQLNIIARIHNDFPTKFGLPRQSGLIDTLESEIIFEPTYRNPDSLRGIEGFSHLWIIWGFTPQKHEGWSPMVRPPRLGGNTRVGVFATRSPNRPNPLGLTCVRLVGLRKQDLYGTTLLVAGADAMDGTPIFDIKPYLTYADSHPEATGGFTQNTLFTPLEVVFPSHLLNIVPLEQQATLQSVLSGDPRPAYQNDPDRIYGFTYAGLDVRFTVVNSQLTVVEIVRLR